MTNHTQLSYVFSMVFKLQLRVSIANTYRGNIDAQKARGGAEVIHRTTWCGETNALWGDMVRWVGFSCGNGMDNQISNSSFMIMLSLSTG